MMFVKNQLKNATSTLHSTRPPHYWSLATQTQLAVCLTTVTLSFYLSLAVMMAKHIPI